MFGAQLQEKRFISPAKSVDLDLVRGNVFPENEVFFGGTKKMGIRVIYYDGVPCVATDHLA